MKDFELNKILDFVHFINGFREIERVVMLRGSERRENDAEHSFQLAIVAWYLISYLKLDHLNLEKVLSFAIIHDLVEIYAGDTYVFEKNVSRLDDKVKRERFALEKIRDEFPEFRTLYENIEEYELKDSEESKFIYALDKLIPVINIYLDEGRMWHLQNVKFDMVDGAKRGKISVDENILDIYEELYKKLEEEKDKLFAK